MGLVNLIQLALVYFDEHQLYPPWDQSPDGPWSHAVATAAILQMWPVRLV